MPVTVVTETFTGPTGNPATGAVTFTPCATTAITPCPVTYQFDQTTLGVFTSDDLEPGCYDITVVFDCRHCPGPVTYPARTVADSPAPLELWAQVINP